MIPAPHGPHGYPVPDSPALGPVPRDYLTPEPLSCLDRPPAPTPRAARPPRVWFAELAEHLPARFIAAHFNALDDLRGRDGATPAEAGAYARAYLLAPTIYAGAGPSLAPPVLD